MYSIHNIIAPKNLIVNLITTCGNLTYKEYAIMFRLKLPHEQLLIFKDIKKRKNVCPTSNKKFCDKSNSKSGCRQQNSHNMHSILWRTAACLPSTRLSQNIIILHYFSSSPVKLGCLRRVNKRF